MTRSIKFISPSVCLGAVAMAALAGLVSQQAQARPLPPNGPYGVLCTCGDLTVTDSNIVGNVGIGDNGAFFGSGSGTITGTVLFSGADHPVPEGPGFSSRFNPNSGIPPGITAPMGMPLTAIFLPPDNNVVQNDITAVNMTSQTLYGPNNPSQPQGATTLPAISGGESVMASSGMMIDGNEVFSTTVGSFPAGAKTFTVIGDGSGTQTVVFNIAGSGAILFDGNIVLTGGLTPDQVLFNFGAGDFGTNTGGPDLTIGTPISVPTTSITEAALATANTAMGTFFDPNGEIHVDNSAITGRVFGGPTDFTITDSTIVSPASSVPEPASLTLLGAGLVAFGIIRRRHRPIPVR